MKNLIHILIVSILTLLTQIGGLVWILNFGFFKWYQSRKSRAFKIGSFIFFYLFATLLIVPEIAKVTGRVPLPITKSGNLRPHTSITTLLNRHYVKQRLKNQLIEIADQINADNSNLKVSYLDANFPFIDGFPLLPHLSHKDGKKVDLAFYYTHNKKEGNLKPATTGYGKFVEPTASEFNQTKACHSQGYWQYDYTKYLTLGSRVDLEFDQQNTKNLVNKIVQNSQTQKVLIEPHLKTRLNLTNSKVRFQGCHAVRHDDHIHHQIK